MPNTTILVDLVDTDGYAKGRTVPVDIEYMVDVDQSYGADADGHRGTLLISREILDLSIAHEDLLVMNSHDVEFALLEARTIFANRRDV